jgi:hypothetical protein
MAEWLDAQVPKAPILSTKSEATPKHAENR